MQMSWEQHSFISCTIYKRDAPLHLLGYLGVQKFGQGRQDKCLTLSVLISLQENEFVFCQSLRASN